MSRCGHKAGRADAPEPRREEHVALDETLRLQFIAERIDGLIDDEVALEIAIDGDQPLTLVVFCSILAKGRALRSMRMGSLTSPKRNVPAMS